MSYDIADMWNLKKRRDTNELIYETEREPQTRKTALRFPKGKGVGGGVNW